MSDGRRGVETAIATRGLTKRYGHVAALTDVTLTVPVGTIYGFLGPNGAGKTTTIRLLMGFIKPTAGTAGIFGHDTWRDGVAARQDLGFLVPADALYPDMSGQALLAYAARLSGRPPTLQAPLLKALEFPEEALGRRLGTYSKGMRQKLALVAAIQHDPALLILDEPTDGLDPLIQRRFEEFLRELNARGRTIFMSSHDLAEVERVCERVAVVRDGHLVAAETIAGLKRLHRRTASVTFAGPVPDAIAHVPHVALLARSAHRADLAIEGDLNPLLRFLATQQVSDFVLAPPRLEDIFLDFYGASANGRAEPEPAASGAAKS